MSSELDYWLHNAMLSASIELDRCSDENKSDDIVAFFEALVPDYEDVMEQVVKDFRAKKSKEKDNTKLA